MAASAKSIAKIRKKKWVQIFAPKYMNHVFLGESYVFESSSLMNKKITVNLMTITNDMKKQNINATFKVDNVVGDKAYTTFTGYEMIPSAVRRLIRRGKNRVDYTTYLLTKDNVPLKCNILIVTAGMTKNSVLTIARLAAQKQMIKIASNTLFSDLAIEVINHKIQEGMRKSLSPLYPMKSCEIRSLTVSQKHLSHDQQQKLKEQQAEAAQISKQEAEAASVEAPEAEVPQEAEQPVKAEEPVVHETQAEDTPKEKKVKARKAKEESAE